MWHISYTYIHTRARTYTHTHVHTCTYTNMHIHNCTYTHTHVHTCTYTNMHIHNCTYTHICTNTLSHMCTHTLTCLGLNGNVVQPSYVYIHTHIVLHTHIEAPSGFVMKHRKALKWDKGLFLTRQPKKPSFHCFAPLSKSFYCWSHVFIKFALHFSIVTVGKKRFTRTHCMPEYKFSLAHRT